MLTVLTQRVTFLSCKWEESVAVRAPSGITGLADILPGAGHRDHVLTRRPDRDEMIRVTTSAENTDGTVVLLCKKFTRCGCHEHRGAILIRINSEAGIWDCCRATEDVAKLR